MPVPRFLRTLVIVLAAFSAGSALAYGAWRFEGRLKDIPAAPAGGLVDGRFACLSYAPYRDGQSPFDKAFVVPPAQIEEDLTILAVHTACVRTYSTDQGLSEVVPIAAKHGLKVLLGAWIGADTKSNERELASVIALANAYPDTVAAVIVGNEVLLRRDLSAQSLNSYIRRVKAAVSVPVTYADVWEFWLRHPELARDVDFITVHMLPYWEDQPIAVPGALRHVGEVLKKVQASFPGRKLFVGEIGWPSLGRMRQDARPSPSDQTRFLREFVAVSQSLGVGYNFIEAFDQNWKRASEGTVGGHWGLYDSHRHSKVEMAGPVSDDPDWHRNWLIGIGIGALVLLSGMAGRGLATASAQWAIAAGLVAGIVGSVLQAHLVYIAETALSALDWIGDAAGFSLSALAATLAMTALMERATGAKAPPHVSSEGVLDTIARLRVPTSRGFLVGLVETLVLIFALATALAILTDGRYRDFPTMVYLTPAIAFAALRIARSESASDDRPAAVLATALAVTAVLTIVNETVRNTQALGWAATALALAAPWVVDAARAVQARSRASRARIAKPSTNPTEAGSAS
jgi:exo-beta-1,3-glucanase (GH17 family)